ncbi:arginyl-tRNA--protein transferase 1-like isoform X2 [Cimex lectularius]|uniref:Arginyl-tRNA--protein transferase 1 n=1 Tax=Cimex lectularius TaxID=79782 RepID=A0A8I6RP94_CIMLE|nr:arginyl-tRNA--protein transferase 1-like isoform X2 [Cimex lectularius]
MPSIVDYFSSRHGSCGYCKSTDTSQNYSMWAHVITAQDYQDLIDRGWRRSGKYCYKPNMKATCCPLYTIKCDATEFKPSKSQKKLLKRVSKYLMDGKRNECPNDSLEDETPVPNDQGFVMTDISSENIQLNLEDIEKVEILSVIPGEGSICTNKLDNDKSSNEQKETEPADVNTKRTQSLNLDGKEAGKPKCKKAKLIRLEKKKQKQSAASNVNVKTKGNQEKSLEDFIIYENPTLQLELRLVCLEPESKQFEDTFEESFAVYQKYQTTIHKDTPSQCNKKQFRRFLVTSPLKREMSVKGLPCGYGSFHQQYCLNGKIIAVGVIDVLPTCISSVYFFYDPDYSFLSLGTYSSLREIAYVRSLNKTFPQMKYYYMGFYIHNCPKMCYKARLSPSFLLCPESYTWHPVDEAKKKLDMNKYSRLGGTEEEDKNCFKSIHDVLIFCGMGMTYEYYKSKTGINKDREIEEYGQLVGSKCAKRMLLYQSSESD